ncbi:MAG: hypothetical protein IKT30_06640 [Bacteroidaceae bacterium]|nr:hypothetical protein [Bacteroidaceae bacterium]
MAVTKDEYELPLGVYDTVKEMAEMQKVQAMRIYKAIWRYEHGKSDRAQFYKVNVDDEERG